MIITTCPQVWEGTGAYWVLKNLEFIAKTKHIPWEQLQVKDADLVITCGIGEVDLLRLRKQGVKIGVLFCSPLAQAHIVPTSLNGDLDSLLRYKNMLESGDIDYIFLVSQKLADLFDNKKIIYLPPPLHWEDFPKTPEKDRKGIGYFGTMDRHKNLATMFGAVKHLEITDPFILTGPEKVSMCSFFSHLFDMKNIVLHQRLPRQALLDVMSKIKLGIQIGFSESFNYAVWELAMLKIPSIVGPSISWYIENEPLREYCLVQNLDDPISIAAKIQRIYSGSDDLYLMLCNVSKDEAILKMERNNQRVQEVLEKI
ncbi:MAG: glycosyltransferase [Candidatus Cloacimonetes bacterium]|nr:glycosyltransferase [Candidatus Cloacimonadota bacterium]